MQLCFLTLLIIDESVIAHSPMLLLRMNALSVVICEIAVTRIPETCV